MIPSFGHIMLVLLVVLILFGAGKLPQVMADLGKGIRSFKDGMKDEKGTGADVSKKDES